MVFFVYCTIMFFLDETHSWKCAWNVCKYLENVFVRSAMVDMFITVSESDDNSEQVEHW